MTAPNHKTLKQFVFRPATVGSLAGLGGGKVSDHRMTKYCKSVFSKSPYSMEKIQYPCSMDIDSISDGVEAADDWARSTEGPKIIFGMSQGAQVASDLIDAYADDPTAPPPSELMFVLIGNPRDSWRGYAASEGVQEVDTGIAEFIRVDTGYKIVQAKIRFDGWTDWPADTANSEAVSNANIGKFLRHDDYPKWDLFDPRNTVWFENENTVHVLSPRELFGLPKYDGRFIPPAACVKQARFARIEKAYNRPPHDPPIVIPKPRNWLETVSMKWEGLEEYIKK